MSIKALREFVYNSIFGGVNKQSQPGAGIVVLRKFGNEFRVLCLQDGNTLDLTKGGMDAGETRLQTAVRETFEESSIDELNFEWGLEPHYCRNIAMFVAWTSQDPEILPNPNNGEYEHAGAYWLSFDKAKSLVKPWLVPAIEYAENKVR